MYERTIKKTFACVLIASLFLAGCAQKVDKNDTIATVNEEKILFKDFKKELTIQVKQNPAFDINAASLDELLDTTIKRRLLIQEAMRLKMAEEEQFADTIRAFWEQTLIRNFVSYKNREFEPYVFVTDKEIAEYYETVKQGNPNIPPLSQIIESIKEKIREDKKVEALEFWLANKRRVSNIEVNKELLSRLLEE
jgi:hypothetical protein